MHSHELALLLDGASIPHAESELQRSWDRYLGGENLVGKVDVKAIDDQTTPRGGGTFDPLSFYVSKRKRSELLELDDDALREWAQTVPGLRWGLRYGRVPRSGE